MSENTPRITGFPEGNIEQWAGMLSAQTPRISQLLFKTIDPLICGSLIELLGSSTRFTKKLGIISPVLTNNQPTAFQVRLVYRVPDFIGYSGSDDAVKQDKQFILNYLQQVPGIHWAQTAVHIAPKDGTVTVSFAIPVGYSQ